MAVGPTSGSLQLRPHSDEFGRTFYEAGWQDIYVKKQIKWQINAGNV